MNKEELSLKEERFCCDNNGNIIDFKDKEPRYNLPQEEVANLLNNCENQLKEKEKKIEQLIVEYLNNLKYFIRHNSKQGIILERDLRDWIKQVENGDKIWQTKNVYEEHDKELIKQVCDKIRQKAEEIAVLNNGEIVKYTISVSKLNQIEKGEDNAKN